MEKNKIILVIILSLFCGCKLIQSQKDNKLYHNQQIEFLEDYFIDTLFEYFPKKVNDVILFWAAPPSCPPTYTCTAQFGDYIFILKKDIYKDFMSTLFSEQIIYKTSYSDTNIIINLTELRKDIFPVKKCNSWFANKFPIPYFERYDFGLGETESKKEVDSEIYFDYKYDIPSDLQVYVINAEAGDFWKESCNENRPEELKEWQHVYSKGFALSEEENIVVFWVMVW